MKNLIEKISTKTGLTKLEVSALIFVIASILTGIVLHFAGVGNGTKDLTLKQKSDWELLQKEKEKLKKEKDTTKHKKTKTGQPEPYQVNVNMAEIADFEQLPGISAKLAEEIVQFRSINGPFKSIDDLILVKGIGPAKLAKIKPWLKL